MFKISLPIAARVLAAAAALACGSAHAFVVETTLLRADGSYSMDGQAPSPLLNEITSGPFDSGVDVLNFQTSAAGSTVGMHSYGYATGDFGSRSSGTGVFDVTGSFTIRQTITNDAVSAQNAYFNFYVTPGVVSTMSLAGQGADSYLNAGTAFNVTLGAQSVWNSSLSLKTTSTSTTATLSGDTSIYSKVSETQYNVAPDYTGRSAFLGLIGAGESVTLTYSLNTWASGLTPTDLVSQPGAALFAAVEPAIVICPTLVGELGCGIPDGPLPEVAGAGSNSGDPFSIDSEGGPITFYPGSGGFFKPDGLQFSITSAPVYAVPEPETYAMMLAGLGMLGWMGRRRRAS